MPWTVDDVDRFKKGLTSSQKRRWVKIANSSYERCAEEGEKTNLDCEVSAIRIANTKFSDKTFSVEKNTCPGIPGLDFRKLQEVALQEAEVTDDFQMILPVGLFYSKWYGEVIITQNYCQAMVDNWKNKVLREQQPFVDTEHDRGKANGWIMDMEARPDGLYAKIEWTDLGKEQLGGGLFKYFSADIDAIVDIDTGEEVYPVLIAVALCNTPVMKTMPQAHLQDKEPETVDSSIENIDYKALAKDLESAIMLSVKNNSAHSDGIYNISEENQMDELLKLFMALSDAEKVDFAKKLSETLNKGKEDQVEDPGAQPPEKETTKNPPPAAEDPAEKENTKLAELVAQNKEMAKQLLELAKIRSKEEAKKEVPKTGDPVIDARMEALEKSNKQMSDHIKKILTKDREEKKKAIISLALKEGRIYPKDKEFWETKFDLDPEGIPGILERTPSVKIFNEEGIGSDGGQYKLKETAEEKKLREKMGITAEDAAKYGENYKPNR